ncbi:flippase [Bradymonas sediminis]|nr:flippase [Bradymonas sediminis]TDP73690.1 O-antigen/teichoic acid export membrane protein [Bradymonas sediminis]
MRGSRNPVDKLKSPIESKKTSIYSRSPAWVRYLGAPFVRILERSKVLQKIVANTGWLIMEKGVSMIVGFFVAVWVIRYLGPELFGKFSYAMSMVGLFGAIATLGLDNIVIRNIVRGDADEGELLATTGVLKFFGGIAATGLAIGSVLLLGQDRETTLLVAIFGGSIILAGLGVPDLWFQAKIRSKYSVGVRLGTLLFTNICKVALILAGASIFAFALVYPIGALFSGVCFVALLKIRTSKSFRLRPRMALVGELLRDSWPLIISGLSIALYMKSDQIMLGEMLDVREVGLYATAVKLSEMWYFFPMVIAGSVFPAIIQAKEGASVETYHRRMQAFYDIMVVISLAIVVPMTFLAGLIVSVMFGVEYEGAGAILRIHIWAFVFVALGVSRGKWLIAENMTRFAMVATLIGAVINIGLNLVLIPAMGGVGAAWATLIAYMISAYFSSLLIPETRIAFKQMTYSLFLPFRIRELKYAIKSFKK